MGCSLFSTVDFCPVTAFYLFQVCLAYLLSSHGLLPPSPQNNLLGAMYLTHMHLTTLSLSFNPIAKVIFLAYCPSPVTLFCTMPLAPFSSLCEIQMISLYFSSHVSSTTPSSPSLPLYKLCQSFKALLYIHFHAFTHAADNA